MSNCGYSHGANPRTGGGNGKDQEARARGRGQPPDGRGKLSLRKLYIIALRPTPGRAGETASAAIFRSSPWANPRTGGGNACPAMDQTLAHGQPPDGRGKPPSRSVTTTIQGPTPGRAGETTMYRYSVSYPWANPRTGGGNWSLIAEGNLQKGQPPDGRGKLYFRFWPLPRIRPTPGRAGETPAPRNPYVKERANPRTGGGNSRR